MDCVDRIFTLVDAKYQEQRNFAYDLGLPPSIISEWRRRRSASYNKRLPQIAEVLGVSAQYLLTGEEKKPTANGSGLTEAEQALMDLFRRLTPEQQEGVIRIVQAAADKL